MTVEFVLVAPLLLVLVLFLVLAGRVVEAHGQVDGAARDAARAASIARSRVRRRPRPTRRSARWTAGARHPCPGLRPGQSGGDRPLVCTLDLTIGFGAMHVTGCAVAPLDQYVGRTYG